MSIKAIFHEYQLLEARGYLPAGLSAKATVATALESGAVAFHKGFYGDAAWGKVATDARAAKHEGADAAMALVEAYADDVAPATRTLRETQTTTDFPLILAMIRQRTRRDAHVPVESTLLFGAAGPVRTARDFKPMRGIRTDVFDRLPKRPEGTNVTYAQTDSTEDGYRVANYELAMTLTWETIVNDDIGQFVQDLYLLGVAARTTRTLVLLEAIRDALIRQTPSGSFAGGSAGAGGPTPANVAWAFDRFANATNSKGQPIPRMLTHIAVPPAFALTARNTLESDKIVIAGTAGSVEQRVDGNVAKGLATPWVDEWMRVVFNEQAGTPRPLDWLAFDNRMPWVEFAALTGYEAGPQTFTKLPDVIEDLSRGSFDNHTIAVKVSDAVGATVTDATRVVRIAGN